MIRAVDHINIVVSNLERSVKFYTEILGFTEIKRADLSGEWIEKIVGLKNVKATVVYVVAPDGEPRIELLHYHTPAGARIAANAIANTVGLRHIAFRVQNIDETVKKLRDAGVALLTDPIKVPNTVVEHDLGSKLLCYFHDPDGTLLELAEYI